LLWQAFIGNPSTCLKVQERHIEKIVELVCQFTDKVPQYVDVLYTIIKESGMAMRCRQVLVIKYLMRSFSQLALDFTSDSDTTQTRYEHQLSDVLILQLRGGFRQNIGGQCSPIGAVPPIEAQSGERRSRENRGAGWGMRTDAPSTAEYRIWGVSLAPQ